MAELDAALMTAGPCERPEKSPLAPRVPETTHRELPAGRGFLRVIDGGKGKVEPAKAPAPIAAPIAAEPAEALFDENGQGNLLAYRPKPRQLSLWEDES